MNERNTSIQRGETTVFIDFTAIAEALAPEQRAAIVADPTCMLKGTGSINMGTGHATGVSWWLVEPRWRDNEARFGGQRWAADGPDIVEVGSRDDVEAAALGIALACEVIGP